MVLLIVRKIRRFFLRMRPQTVKDLGFAGHEWPKSVTKVTDYSEALVIESKGVLPGRGVSHAFEKREVFEISNARVDPAMGEVYLESGEFVIQSTAWHTYVPYPERRPLGGAQRLFDDNGFIRLPSWTYYHQIIENLPPYLFLKSLRPLAQTLIPAESSQLVREILDSLGFTYVTHQRQIIVNKLFMVSQGRDSGYPHPKDLQVLRSYFTGENKNEQTPEQILYISRLKSTRSFPGEARLIALLERDPRVKVVEAETLSFLDQRKVFSTAKVIIGIHGAGLTNQIWMRPGGSILEISDPNYSNAVYECLASSLGHSYSNVWVGNSGDLAEEKLKDILSFVNSIL